MASPKDRITCHVLDTSTGLPARSLRVKLELASSPSSLAAHHGHAAQSTKTFESRTDDDGRITVWLPYSSALSSGDIPVHTLDDVLGAVEEEQKKLNGAEEGEGEGEGDKGPASSKWTLRFDTEEYYGEGTKTFFPEVAVTFRVESGQKYHVPLLLSPFGYTTYRGS